MENKGGNGVILIDKIKETRISISIAALFSVIVGLWYGGAFANAQYVHWHDTRYAKRTEIITIAQAQEIRNELFATNELASDNSDKLDRVAEAQMQLSQDFSTYAASSLVSQAATDLRNHLTTRPNASDQGQWDEDKARLEQRLKTAEEYRMCVIEGKTNCGRFLLSR
jgi:hypothetical protein